MAQNDSTKLQENPNMHWQPQTRKHSLIKSSMLRFGMGESVNEWKSKNTCTSHITQMKHEWTNDWVSGWVSEWMTKRRSEWKHWLWNIKNCVVSDKLQIKMYCLKGLDPNRIFTNDFTPCAPIIISGGVCFLYDGRTGKVVQIIGVWLHQSFHRQVIS